MDVHGFSFSLAQGEDLLLAQEEDLRLAQSTLASLESTLVLAERARLPPRLTQSPGWPVAWLGAPPGCPVGRRPGAARLPSTTQSTCCISSPADKVG